MPRVLHFEIRAEDPEKLVGFYGTAFGWTFKKWDGPMDYWLITTGPKEEPGIDGGLSKGHPFTDVVNTIGVLSIDESLAAIEKAGGFVVMPKSPIPGVGWLAHFRDPEGNAFGIMQSDMNAR